jgi:hypothetical protein
MISMDDIHQVASLVHQQGLNESLITQLRVQYPGKHFTWCMEDDINSGSPVFRDDRLAIYLVDSRDHCSTLTKDMAAASGFVLAEIMEE